MKGLGMTAVALALIAGCSAMLFGLAPPMVAATAAESRKPSPGQEGPVILNKLAMMPDLVVASASVTPVCNGKTWTAKIVATVKNNGQVAADLSKITWQIILAADWFFTPGEGFLENPSPKTVKPSVGGPKELKPGESWTGTLTITGIPKANVAKAKKAGHPTAQFGFKLVADPTNSIAEANEKNNEKLI